MVLLWITVVRIQSSVIFFVKQKTAYELRISDWSSDVCSSDLLARAVGHGGGRVVPQRPLLRIDRALARLRRAAARRAHERDRGEIGRASCREGVCQYV